MYKHIRKQLIAHGMSPRYKGFRYLINAIAYVEEKYKNGVWYVKMTDVFKETAKTFNTTRYGVEHAIRNCIIKSTLGNMTVAEYITATADHNVFAGI